MKRIPLVVIVLAGAHFALGDEESASQSTPAPDKSRYTLFNPTPIDLRRAYNIDWPSKTDSPFTVDAVVSNQQKEQN
jgi:hypothetical protein